MKIIFRIRMLRSQLLNIYYIQLNVVLVNSKISFVIKQALLFFHCLSVFLYLNLFVRLSIYLTPPPPPLPIHTWGEAKHIPKSPLPSFFARGKIYFKREEREGGNEQFKPLSIYLFTNAALIPLVSIEYLIIL